MFRTIGEAWIEIEQTFMQHDEAKEEVERAERAIKFGKEMFYLGAYTSLVLSNCIARFTIDPDSVIAQLKDVKDEITAYLDTVKARVPEDEDEAV